MSPLGEDDPDVRARIEGSYERGVRALERAASARTPCAAALVIATREWDGPRRLETLRKALRAEPGHAAAAVALAEVAEPREAEEALRAAVEKAPHEPGVRVALGSLLARHGDPREAAVHLLWACTLGEVGHEELRKTAVKALLAKDLVDEASRVCGFGRWFDTPDALAVQVAARSAKAGKPPAAQGWPGVPEPSCEPLPASERAGAALRLYARGATIRATELFREALALDPGEGVAGSHLALFEQHRGRWRTGTELAERVLAANPRATEVWLVLAGLRRAGGDRAGERAALDEACRANLPEGFRDLATLLREHGDVRGALEMQRRAVSARPGDPWLLETLADRLAEAGRRSEAVAARVDALVASPHFLDEALRAGLAALPARSAEEEELARALEPSDQDERLERLARHLLARGREADACRLLARLHAWGRASGLELLFDLQARAKDVEGLLESTARVLAGGGPLAKAAAKRRRAALLEAESARGAGGPPGAR